MPPLTKLDQFSAPKPALEGLNAPAPIAPLSIKSHDFQPLQSSSKFCKIDESTVQTRLKLDKGEGQTEKQKLDQLHTVTLAMKNENTPASMKKFFSNAWTAVKDSKVGRFFTRNIIPKFTTSEISRTEINAEFNQASKKTTLEIKLQGKISELDEQGQWQEKDMDSDDSKIVVEYDRMRGSKWTERLKAWWKNEPAPPEPLQIALKAQEDMTRQARLRNCGIGYKTELPYKQSHPGYLAMLQRPTKLKLSDFSVDELKKLKTECSNSSEDQEFLDAAIQNREQIDRLNVQIDSQGIKKSDRKQFQTELKEIDGNAQTLGSLKKVVLQSELERIRAVDNLCGPDSFTSTQRDNLDSLQAALSKNDNDALDSALLNSGADLGEMSLMVDAALRREGDFNKNLETLRLGAKDGILPRSVISSPWFFSPGAATKLAENIDKLASIPEAELTPDQKTFIANITEKQPVANLGIIEEEPNLQQDLNELGDDFRDLAANKKAMYRFQGLMFALAGNNADQIRTGLIDQVHTEMQNATGLNDTGDQVWKTALGGVLLAGGAIQAARGKLKSAAVLGLFGGVGVLAGGANNDTKKVRARTAMMVDALLAGMNAGTLDPVVKANKIMADIKADDTAKDWVNQQIGNVSENGENVTGILGDSHKIETLEKIDATISDFEKFKENDFQGGANRAALLGNMDKEIKAQIDALTSLKNSIQTRQQSLGESGSVLNPLDAGVRVHGELNLRQTDAPLEIQVADELRTANKENLDQAQALVGSLNILNSAFKGDGEVRKSINSVENKLENLLKTDAAKLDEQQIRDVSAEIEKVRTAISENADKLTSSHADLLNKVVDALDENAGRIVGMKLAMNRMASALSMADDTYLSGDGFQSDLELLEKELVNASEGGKQNLALFNEKETAAAAKQILDPFLKDAKEAQKSWNDFKTFRNELQRYPGNRSSMNSVLSDLTDSKNGMLKAAEGLKTFADKHAEPAGVEAEDFHELAQKEADGALLKSAASLLGVENNPSTAKSLALFAGPFAKNDPIFQAAKKYLDQAVEGKNEKLNELFKELPEFSIRDAHSDGVDGSISDWKNQVDPQKAIDILNTLVPGSDNDSTALGKAVKIAGAFEGPDSKTIEKKIYFNHIDTQFTNACQNKDILSIYGEEKLDIQKVILNHSSKLEVLKAHGHQVEEGLDIKSILDKYRSNRDSLEISELSQLAALSNSLATLSENVEVTEKARLEADMLTLLTNSKPELQNLQGNEQELKNLKAADFSFKPIQQEQQYLDLNKVIGETQNKLDAERTTNQQAKTQVSEARNLLAGVGVSNDVVNKIGGDEKITSAAQQLAKAVDHWKSGYWRKDVQDFNKANNNNQKLSEQNIKDFKETKKQEKGLSKQLDHQLLRYLDTGKLESNEKIRHEDLVIAGEEGMIRNSAGHRIVANIRMDFGGGDIISRDNIRDNFSADAQGYLAQLPLDKRPYKEKNLSDTISRMANDPQTRFMERGERAKNLLDKIVSEKISSDAVEETSKIIEEANSKRSKILTEVQNAQVKLGIRSAVIKACLIDQSIKPENLNNDNKEDVKKTLESWGWSREVFPADQLIELEIESIKTAKKIPDAWLQEAGGLKHKISQQLEQLNIIQEEIRLALNGLAKKLEANSSLEKNLNDAADYSDENAMNAIAAETLKNVLNNSQDLNLTSSYDIARGSLNSLFDSYSSQFLGAKDKLDVKKAEILTKIQECEKNQASWYDISKAVSESLDGTDGSKALFDVAFDVENPAKRVASHDLLTSITKREFEFSSAQAINENYMKVDLAINKETEKINDQVLTVQNLKVGDLLSDRNNTEFFMNKNKLRTWVKSYSEFQGVKDAENFARTLANMPASEFLASFQPGGDFIKFLYEKEGKNEKTNIPGLQSAMLALRDTHSLISAELRGFDGSFDYGDQLSSKIKGLSSEKIKDSDSTGSALVSFTRNFDPARAKQKLQDLLTQSKKIAESSNLAPKVDFYDFKVLSDKKFVELVQEKQNPYRIPAQVIAPVQENASEQDVVDEANPFQFYPHFA